VRESELLQLSGHLTARRDQLPADLLKQLEAAQAQAEKAFVEQLAKVEKERDALNQQAEQARRESLAGEEAVRKKNVDLDAQEETLKARSAELLAQIDSYNARIRELGTGFGFFAHLFSMRRLHQERERLEAEQATAAGQIESLRMAWAEREKGHTEAEAALKAKWVELRTRASAVQAKVDALVGSRSQLVFRSAAEKVLFERRPVLPKPTKDDPKCGRCQSPNPAASSFCQICAKRLKPDRPDLEGSLAEIAEANFHYTRFSEGMRTSQEIIGLVRGLKSGIVAFRKSVASMLGSQNQHSLKVLTLVVPPHCVVYGKHLDRLRDAAVPELSLHPKEFGERIAEIAKVFNQDGIKAWFEGLGAELSAQAKRQWG